MSGVPGPGTRKQEEMLKQLVQLLHKLPRGQSWLQNRALEFICFLFSEPAVALCVFCFCFLLGASRERASEVFPL